MRYFFLRGKLANRFGVIKRHFVPPLRAQQQLVRFFHIPRMHCHSFSHFSLWAREDLFLAWPRKRSQKEGHPEPCPAGSLALPVFCARAKLATLKLLLACSAKYRQCSAAAKGVYYFD